MKHRFLYPAAGVAAMCVTLGAYSLSRGGAEAASYTTQLVTRGDTAQVVSATGTLDAVTTVAVGSQVSGTIATLGADFNSIVRKGQVIATLDPSLMQAQLQQAMANLVRAEADLQRAQVAAADAGTKLARAGELSEKALIARADMEAADVAKRSADAEVHSSQASVRQAQAAVDQAKVNLRKTVIAAPIDGIVVARNVDVGQTVAASVSAPTLFTIAADLTRMRLSASIDESDVGLIRAGQPVTFRVGAYPDVDFTGTVYQLRLNPVVTQNVVTYAAIVDVPNPELRLKPGMTATAELSVERRSQVLRVPNAALRYRPAGQPAASGPAATGPAVWVQQGDGLSRVAVETGLSDGRFTEIRQGDLPEGSTVVTGAAATARQATGIAPGLGNPFAAQTGRSMTR